MLGTQKPADLMNERTLRAYDVCPEEIDLGYWMLLRRRQRTSNSSEATLFLQFWILSKDDEKRSSGPHDGFTGLWEMVEWLGNPSTLCGRVTNGALQKTNKTRFHNHKMQATHWIRFHYCRTCYSLLPGMLPGRVWGGLTLFTDNGALCTCQLLTG